MTGAGIMLMTDGVPKGSVCTTGAVSAEVERLQFELGEGPCVDACHQDRPVLDPDLADPTRPRWPAFTGPAVEAGVPAIFGFPLQVGAVGIGALNLYRDLPGPLTDDQHADALVVADVAALAMLILQADAPPGTIAAPSTPVGTSDTSCTRPRAWSPPNSTPACPRLSCGCGPTPSATAGPSPRSPRRWSTAPCASTRAGRPQPAGSSSMTGVQRPA
ncbi:MAG: GAF domain-containing protein [Actinomycetota bacterium]|nr:GAF domain-containing protein [Actinomycetota bacterium]